MTDEYRRLSELTRAAIIPDDERRQTLKNIERRRAELLSQQQDIEQELAQMDAVEAGHRAALGD